MSELTNQARNYIALLRGKCKAALKRGEQIDFWDALATSRMTGENAVYWLLPELRKTQAERAVLVEACQAVVASLAADEEILIDWDPNGFDAQLLALVRAALTKAGQ